MKKAFYIIVFLFLFVSLSLSFPAREIKKEYVYCMKDGQSKVDTVLQSEYEVLHGMKDGKYISWHDFHKGIKWAEGTFKHNQRYGLWTVWDETGKMRMQRNYKNGFEFERIYPPVPKEGAIPMLMKPQYVLKYNKDICIDYSPLAERAVYYSKRIWRNAYLSDNQIIQKSKIEKIILEHILNGNIEVYKSDDFNKKLEPAESKTAIQPEEQKIIGFRLMEDFFFDTDRMISETRIIGLSVLAIKDSKETVLGCIYYPRIRKYLAKEKVNCADYPDEIKTLDDVFFFRYFASQIWKESNVYDRTIEAYCGSDTLMAKNEAVRIERGMLNAEHDIWIGFTKKPN